MTIYIYETELEEALHTLRHEFFEWMLHKELIKPYSTLCEQLQKALLSAMQETAYANKEALIELLVKLEEGKLDENCECDKKDD